MMIVPLITKGYRAISAVVVFEFQEGGCTEADSLVYIFFFGLQENTSLVQLHNNETTSIQT
jgi:hypothetical protein